MAPSVLSPTEALIKSDDFVDHLGAGAARGTEMQANSDIQSATNSIMKDEKKYSVVGMPTLPVVMARGSGAFLWDINGKKYIDFNAGFLSVNQGHCHPRIVVTMIEQWRLLTLPSRVIQSVLRVIR
ncbi:uncharacterized protein PAC_18060 [Phialocephala subalpina]|uniref:Ornithine aminotransferase n=1 Tax=Phialocephala subalpina TaxID=576137 RepID=A0A1L7XT14_9HELO|nr:uncharacterized protein PAC_18060 [Phialocephala subalpina]